MTQLNLATYIFLVVLLTQIVAWVGKGVLQDLAWGVYSGMFLSRTSAKQRALRKQVLEDKSELSKTSSQDEFSKWAKLKRKVDKGLADLEQLNNVLGGAKSSFNSRFSSILWILTTGAQMVFTWYYRKSPIFFLPSGWLPGPVRWVLSFPSAPLGAVSSTVWAAVCKRVLITGEEIIKDLLAPSPVAMPNTPFPSGAGGQKEPKIMAIEQEKLD